MAIFKKNLFYNCIITAWAKATEHNEDDKEAKENDLHKKYS